MDHSVGTVLMDSSSGTIIYLILMVLVFAASAMKKKKRRSPADKTDPQGKPATATPGGKITDFLNKLMDEAIPEVKQPAHQFPDDLFPDEPTINKDFPEAVDEMESESFIPEGVSVFSNDDPSTSFIETGIEDALATTSHKMPEEKIKQRDLTRSYENDLDTIITNFDFKKAIIFSEILKPKYFKIHDY
jgi:hypothetical protein